MSSTLNKQDANTSTSTLQVQGPIQAQDTLPEAILQDEQNAIVLQVGRKPLHGKPINSLS